MSECSGLSGMLLMSVLGDCRDYRIDLEWVSSEFLPRKVTTDCKCQKRNDATVFLSHSRRPQGGYYGGRAADWGCYCNVSIFWSLLYLLRTQKLKSHLVRTQSLNILPLNSGVGQYIAIHATLTARDFFLAYFYTSGPFTCMFSKTSPDFSLCWLWLTHGSCVGPQNKIGHPAGCRFPCWVPAEYK